MHNDEQTGVACQRKTKRLTVHRCLSTGGIGKKWCNSAQEVAVASVIIRKAVVMIELICTDNTWVRSDYVHQRCNKGQSKCRDRLHSVSTDYAHERGNVQNLSVSETAKVTQVKS